MGIPDEHGHRVISPTSRVALCATTTASSEPPRGSASPERLRVGFAIESLALDGTRPRSRLQAERRGMVITSGEEGAPPSSDALGAATGTGFNPCDEHKVNCIRTADYVRSGSTRVTAKNTASTRSGNRRGMSPCRCV